jgi:hypothetical protein
MFKLPVHTWILNAAAVLAHRHGAVTAQAQQAQCSRQTVYQHARKVEEQLAARHDEDADLAALRAENEQLKQALAEQQRTARDLVRCDAAKLRQLATTAFAMGLSYRQIEDFLGSLLGPEKAPDHATVARWVADDAERAGRLLDVLDAACAPHVQTLALDEIFVGGDRPW